MKLDHAFLVRVTGVDVDDRHAVVEEVCYGLDMDDGISADRPFADELFNRDLCLDLLPNRTGIANIKIFLEAFGCEPPKLIRVPRVVVVADDDGLLGKHGSIWAGFFPASLAPPSHSDLNFFQVKY